MSTPRKERKTNPPNSPITHEPPADGGRMIVLTAPLTEAIDHAGYFIQMALASLPIWMEGVINRKYPKWREVEHNPDGSARYMPAGVRLVEKSLLREYRSDDVVACFPDDLAQIYWTTHACRRSFDAQSTRRHVCRRCLHINLRIVEDADQLSLRTTVVCQPSKPVLIATTSK